MTGFSRKHVFQAGGGPCFPPRWGHGWHWRRTAALPVPVAEARAASPVPLRMPLWGGGCFGSSLQLCGAGGREPSLLPGKVMECLCLISRPRLAF